MHSSRSPKQGFKIIQELYQKHLTHQGARNNLINAYIRFGYHDKAIAIINDISVQNNRVDTQTLKWRAWSAHKQGNISLAKQLYQEVLDKSIYVEIDGPIHQFKKQAQGMFAFQKMISY